MDDVVAVFLELDARVDFVEVFLTGVDFVEGDFDLRAVGVAFFAVDDFCAKGVKI